MLVQQFCYQAGTRWPGALFQLAGACTQIIRQGMRRMLAQTALQVAEAAGALAEQQSVNSHLSAALSSATAAVAELQQQKQALQAQVQLLQNDLQAKQVWHCQIKPSSASFRASGLRDNLLHPSDLLSKGCRPSLCLSDLHIMQQI